MPFFLTGLADWLRAVGLNVIEYDGWERRARSSGGFPTVPLGVMWHHTASGPSWDGQKDADYIAVGADISPISNLYIERSGTVWVIAAGATNTNGSGNAINFSRGMVPKDCMNTHAVGVEMGNNGVGEPWPQVQVDAMFKVSNAVNEQLANQPSDVCTHWFYAPTRKIDPAGPVNGPWNPRPCNNSGTWELYDIEMECIRRAEQSQSQPIQGSNVTYYKDDRQDGWQIWAVGLDAIGNAWTCPINDLPDGGKWEVVNPIVGNPVTVPFGALVNLMDRQNRPTNVGTA